MELEVAVLQVLAAPRQEAGEVSIQRFSVRPGLNTHTIPDPIILGDSDDKSAGAESETDYGNLEADLTAKSCSSPHIADSDMANGKGFGSGTTYTSDSDRIVADHQDDDDDSGVLDSTRL